MQNIHSHVWSQEEHFTPQMIAEAQIARGGEPVDLTVRFDALMQDVEPFEKVVIFGLKARLSGVWVPDEYVAALAAQDDKLYGFASCDPTQPDYVEELHDALEDLGLCGLKMGPIYAGFDPRDPRCDVAYRYCEDHGLPIVFHTGTTFNQAAPLGVSRPWLFDEVAIRHPELRMVLAHVGHPFSGECLAVIRKHPHVYADISAIFYRPWQFYNTMILAQEYGVTHKLLFGTDYPFARGQESIDGLRHVNAVIGTATLPRVSEEVIEGILTRDAFALLGIAE